MSASRTRQHIVSPWAFPLRLPEGPLRRSMFVAMGRLIGQFRPTLRRRMEQGEAPRNRIERMVLAARVAHHRKKGDLSVLARQHTRFWEGESAVAFHAVTVQRCRSKFLREHAFVIDMLADILQKSNIRKLCEIGCGSGQVMEILASKFPSLEHLTGLDLSARQIELNRTHHANPRLFFVHADATTWLPTHASSDWLIMTYGGVLEYFTEASLIELLASMAARSGAIVLVEPIDPLHDLQHDIHSHAFGMELSFSHNYAGLLESAGFQIHCHRESTNRGMRWLAISALSPSVES